ncbi:MAG: branched-chain amino acid ABC transporter permease [Candidatus Heimdallarchaeota archaeon]|nr:branched-chain amino acid ABC transporter permease [Candidatus Heimdallarchaeota archaeon]
MSKIKELYHKNPSNFLVVAIGLPIIFLFFLPLMTGNITGTTYFINSFALIFIYAAMAITLNLEVGYLGLPNFGKVGFIAIGGYSYAIFAIEMQGILQGLTLVLSGLVVSIIITGFFGMLLTLPTLKLREDYLAIVTIVAAEIIRIVINNEQALGSILGFTVNNMVFDKFEPQAFISGLFINWQLLVILFIVIGLTHLIYRYYSSQEKTDLGLQRSVLILSIITVGMIASDYNSLFGSEPFIGLHLLLFLGIASLIMYKSFSKSSYDGNLKFFGLTSRILNKLFINKMEKRILEFFERASRILNKFFLKIKNNGNSVFIAGYGVVLINYLLGLALDGSTEIRFTAWFTMLITLFSLIGLYLFAEELYYSPFGRTLRAIREDETSAISVGKSVFNYRLRALTIAAGAAGFVGAIFAQFMKFVAPNNYLPLVTFTLYIMLIIGGTGNNKGAFFGAFIVQMLFQITRGPIFANVQYNYPWGQRADMSNIGIIMTGIILIVFLIYSPAGIIPEKRNNNERYYSLHEYSQTDSKDNKLLENLLKLSKASIEDEEWIS